MAVDDSASAAPTIPAAVGCSPRAQANRAIRVPHVNTWPFEGQFQADGEQQDDDADFGEGLGALHLADHAQTERTDNGPGEQVAEHRAHPQPLHQRHHQDRRRKQDDQILKLGVGAHPVVLPPFGDAAVAEQDREIETVFGMTVLWI